MFSVLTPSGRGAIAVVAVGGPGAVAAVDQFFRAKNRKPLAEQAVGRIVYGHWLSDGEDVVVCRRDAEHVEVHCHGGTQAIATIVADLAVTGCKEVPWQEWLSRDESCPLQIEAQVALAEAVSARAAVILLYQYHGALREELARIVDLMSTNHEVAAERLVDLLATTEFGMHLTRPWQVVIAGLPNVGKSSLINALVGYRRAIVFDQPGTTRDVVTAATVVDGWPISLSDTAGLHAAHDELEAAGIELAKERLARADLVIWVLDATEVMGDPQELMHRQSGDLGLALPAQRLVVLNKIDRGSGVVAADGVIATSATVGTGIEELLTAISSTLVPRVPNSGEAVVFTERQRAGLEEVLAKCREGSIPVAMEKLRQLARPAR